MTKRRWVSFIRQHIKQAQQFTNVVMILCASAFTIMYNLEIQNKAYSSGTFADVIISMKYIPITVVSALCGSVSGLVCITAIFIAKVITEGEMSYLIFIYLAVSVLANEFSRKGYYSSAGKTIFASICIAFLDSDVWAFLLYILSDGGIDSISTLRWDLYLWNELPGAFISGAYIYFVLSKSHDWYRNLFYNSIFYGSNAVSEEDQYEKSIHSKFGFALTRIMVIQAVGLGATAMIMGNTIIQSMNLQHNVSNDMGGAGWGSVTNTAILEKNVVDDIVGRSTINGLQFSSQPDAAFILKLAMLIFIIVTPISVISNHYAQRRIVKPIRKISKAADMIANMSDNDYERQQTIEAINDIEIGTNDEIEDLYGALKKAASAMHDLIISTKEKKEVEYQLEVANAANDAKSSFLSNMSHEIRTPINAVLGFDEMILRECNDPNIIEYAKDIQSSGTMLLSLINDILDFSKIEAGKMELTNVEYDLGSMVNDCVNMVRKKAEDKGIELIVNVDENIPHLLIGDEVHIRQCIVNILTNAVKYTEHGSVTFSMGYEKKRNHNIVLKVSVKDTGIGIKEEDIEKLFSPFERIEESRNRNIEGTGLGMNIVKKLLAMMDTQLNVESQYGRGSIFSFDVTQDVADAAPVGDIAKAFDKVLPGANAYHESFRAPKARILVIDDISTNLKVVQGLLKHTKVRIDTGMSGLEALDLVKRNHYDVIFLDQRMPEMDGIETFHRMKAMEDSLNQETPVIALTANAVAGSREIFIHEGFSDYLSKPIDAAKLEDMLHKHLPEELVECYAQKDSEELDDVFDTDADKKAEAELYKVSGIDVTAAIENCGNASLAVEVIRDFWTSIDTRADKIEEYVKTGDIRNYTIQVHGLKSAARSIGALEMSELAAHLEKCGDAGDTVRIAQETPKLLDMYREYINRLRPLIRKNEDSTKALISEEELQSALEGMREFIEGSYFDSADDIMKMLEEYRMPDDFMEKYEQIIKLMAAVDRDGLLNIL